MPDIITHYIFGLDTIKTINPSPLYKMIQENTNVFLIGLQGPDPIYYHQLRKKNHKAFIASRMHSEKTSEFIISALCHTKQYHTNSPAFAACLSYISGFICHYILDFMTHPYIFYLSGNYIENVPETEKYLGLHKKLELAIDSILCKQILHKDASHLKINKGILPEKDFPEYLVTLYNDVLFLLFGMNNSGEVFKHAYHDMKKYFNITYDPMGTKKFFGSALSSKLPKQLAPFALNFSYHHCVNPDFDYMNLNRHVWLHPVTGNVYTFSFYDLLRNALKKSSALLASTYEFAYSHISADEFRMHLPNVSYLTGLPVTDTRPMKYFSDEYTNL